MKTVNCSLVMVVLYLVQIVFAPPVTQKKNSGGDEKDNEIKDDLEDYMEYHRYLKEIVQTLESDPDFREKLEKAEEVDIRSGKIALELEKVSHNVRSKLDELKRQELERLRHLATKEFELTNDIDTVHAKLNNQAQHLDHSNLHTFEVEDLKKLIKKTTEDLAEADKKRRDDFKQYEMQKEFEKQQKLQSLDDDHKKEYEKEIKAQEEKHKNHEKLHHPGTKEQLEEVWEKQDHMENQEFDPKIFFMMHDVDGNGYWDQDEVKALFLKELDKMYKQGAPGSDLRERQEEMERMREHVFAESDTNRDNLISYDEFLVQTRRAEFSKDPGWQGLDEQQVYTPEEYHNFEKQRLEEVQKLIDQGMLSPHPQYYQQGFQQGYPQQGYPQQGNLQQAYQQPQQYQPNNQVPPAYQQHVPQYQYPPSQGQPQYQAPHQQAQAQYQNLPAQPLYQNPPAQGQYQNLPVQGQAAYPQSPQINQGQVPPNHMQGLAKEPHSKQEPAQGMPVQGQQEQIPPAHGQPALAPAPAVQNAATDSEKAAEKPVQTKIDLEPQANKI